MEKHPFLYKVCKLKSYDLCYLELFYWSCKIVYWQVRDLCLLISLLCHSLNNAQFWTRNQFCIFGFRFFVLCISQNKRSQKTKVPLIFNRMEANLHHPVFDFISVTNLIRHSAFSENSLWYTSTVKFYLMSNIERMKGSEMLS